MDIGGPWTKYDVKVDSSSGQDIRAYWTFGTGLNEIQDYHGRLYASNEVSSIVGRKLAKPSTDLAWFKGLCPSVYSDSDLVLLGTKAIARVAPTNPTADMATALGELLHDGLPSLPGKGEGNIGKEYLNQQFEWSPTISDGKSFIRAVRNYDQIIDQFLRDRNRLIRRRYDFPKVKSISLATTTNSPAYPPTGGLSPNGQQEQFGTLQTVTTTENSTWFEGTFRYYVPSSAFGRRIRELDRAYGLVPGPDTLWQLTPWSWLVDWFVNARDVTRNLSAFYLDGLVMPHGYVMSDTRTVKEFTLNLQFRDGLSWYPVTLFDRVEYRCRQRVQATPFGFGLSWTGFNPFRLSILAALGISRAS
jgi:hypothetical protein